MELVLYSSVLLLTLNWYFSTSLINQACSIFFQILTIESFFPSKPFHDNGHTICLSRTFLSNENIQIWNKYYTADKLPKLCEKQSVWYLDPTRGEGGWMSAMLKVFSGIGGQKCYSKDVTNLRMVKLNLTASSSLLLAS